MASIVQTNDPFAGQQADLARLASQDRLRRLAVRHGIDFASNDYLGLAGSARLGQAIVAAVARGVPVGAGGSRLLRGNHAEHEALEAEAAHYFGSESALYFSSGFGANSALFATLPQRGDLVVYDDLIHASAHEGLRLTRAESVAARHNDSQSVADEIAKWRAAGGRGKVWIAVESLYSMDGDRAPLDELAELADRHDGVLLIDEAHATGVFGAGGKGLAAGLEGRGNVITLHTCGKALGCEGALVCAPASVREFLINRGRGFVFSTAPSPLMAAAVREALRILADEPVRRAQLAGLIETAGQVLARHGVTRTGSQIVPLVLGADARAMEVAGRLQAAGFDVRGIRPPTVPEGQARLRISLTLNVGEAEVAALSDALEIALR